MATSVQQQAQQPPPQIKYIPEEHERAYYQALFRIADTQGKGQIGGAEAVSFFTKSQLSLETLKHIWTIADQPPSNYLDLPKFAVALRLIQCIQNGQRGQGPNLATPPGVVLRPVLFEGVSGVAVPFPTEPSAGSASAGKGLPTTDRVAGPPPTATPQPQANSYPHQQQAPMSSSSRPSIETPRAMAMPTPPPNSMALTAQDPYGMTPTDLARYDVVFKEYCKEDGFVHGNEAVALFSKSGMPQPSLAAIWNMVDYPVDNRLDKLEFAMAMHLIVCISKKNMPMPPALPNSLVLLKQQLRPMPPQGVTPQPMATQAMPPQNMPPQNMAPQAMATQSMPPQNMAPAPRSQTPVPPLIPASRPQSALANAATDAAVATAILASTKQPPPAAQGAMNISDAFEGLSAEPTTFSMLQPEPEPAPTPVPPSPVPKIPSSPIPRSAATSQPRAVSSFQSQTQQAPSTPKLQGTAAVVAVSSSSGGGGDASVELIQMRELLTKLQAENISLRAQMSGMSEEEGQVQKELATTIAEVARLSSVLSHLRQEVASQKSRFLDLTAALKSAKDNAGLLNQLIGEETTSKEAFEQANASISSLPRGSAASSSVGYYDTLQSQGHGASASQSFGSSTYNGVSSGYGQYAPQTKTRVTEGIARSNLHVNTVDDAFELTLDPVQEMSPSHEMQNDSLSPVAEDPSKEQQSYDFIAVPTSYHQQIPSQQFQQMNLSQMDQRPQNPDALHVRDLSTTSGFGFHDGDFMGGGSLAPVPTTIFSGDAAPTTSKPDFEQMRRKAKDADDVAGQAEESIRILLSQVSELRKAAEEAEGKVMQLRKETEVPGDKKKKGGLFSGKSTKKDAKLMEQLTVDAKLKKDALLQAQGQVNDAQALALETRREADRLRRELETAEVNQASMDSLQHHQRSNGDGGYSNKDQFYQQQSSAGQYGNPFTTI